MQLYKVEFAPRTESQLELIPKKIRKQVLDRIEKLEQNPRPENVEPLQGKDGGLYRICQGDRIVYSIEDQKLLILVVRVVHRKEVYTKKHSK